MRGVRRRPWSGPFQLLNCFRDRGLALLCCDSGRLSARRRRDLDCLQLPARRATLDPGLWTLGRRRPPRQPHDATRHDPSGNHQSRNDRPPSAPLRRVFRHPRVGAAPQAVAARRFELRPLQGLVDQAHENVPSSSRIARRTCPAVSLSVPVTNPQRSVLSQTALMSRGTPRE